MDILSVWFGRMLKRKTRSIVMSSLPGQYFDHNLLASESDLYQTECSVWK